MQQNIKNDILPNQTVKVKVVSLGRYSSFSPLIQLTDALHFPPITFYILILITLPVWNFDQDSLADISQDEQITSIKVGVEFLKLQHFLYNICNVLNYLHNGSISYSKSQGNNRFFKTWKKVQRIHRSFSTILGQNFHFNWPTDPIINVYVNINV